MANTTSSLSKYAVKPTADTATTIRSRLPNAACAAYRSANRDAAGAPSA